VCVGKLSNVRLNRIIERYSPLIDQMPDERRRDCLCKRSAVSGGVECEGTRSIGRSESSFVNDNAVARDDDSATEVPSLMQALQQSIGTAVKCSCIPEICAAANRQRNSGDN